LKASELSNGTSAKIVELTDSAFSQRLAEMGCVPGTPIQLLFKAPAGDPIAFDIDGYILALRKNEADCILVQYSEIYQ
jgi:Fe2+ transport system protein FeoA